MGAEGNKSQPPAEQGHQIKVRCYDLVHPAVRVVQLVIKKRKKSVVPLVSSQRYRLQESRRVNLLGLYSES